MSDRYDAEIKLSDAAKMQKTIESFLQNFGKDISGALGEALDEVGKEAAKKLKATSPKKTGAYARAWTYRRKVKGKNGVEAKVYNAKRGQLTHLLEYGHPLISNGKVVGQVRGQSHIGPVNEWVQSELPKRFAQKVQK